MKKFCAVHGLMKNEKYFLPWWVKYYGELFGNENLYILDHQSTDGSTDNLKCNVELVENEQVHFNVWMIEVITKKHVELLEEYEYVISVDADEFIIPNPDKYRDLKEYVEKMKADNMDIVRCSGYEVLHQRKLEPVLDWNIPLLKQRKYWIKLDSYNKPLISSRQVWWAQGRHFEDHLRYDPADEDLVLCHLHRIDYDTCKRKVTKDVDSMPAYQKDQDWIDAFPNFWQGKKFDTYFDNPNCHIQWGASPTELEEIPEKFRDKI